MFTMPTSFISRRVVSFVRACVVALSSMQVAVAQQTYVRSSNPDQQDYFGQSVAISGDTMLVGASGERSNATGVNGNQLDNSLLAAGAAYVFVRTGGTWVQQAYLKASNTGASDEFGAVVALSGNTAAVAAYRERSNATGVNGNQSDNSVFQAGAVYVFVRNGSTWTQQAYIKASNTSAQDNFGWRLALDGDTLVVGAGGEDSGAPGVNGNQSDNSMSDAGAAYVFVRQGTTWTQEAYLKAHNPSTGAGFGNVVAISGDTIVVTAQNEDTGASDSGAGYVFVRNQGVWTQQAFLKASNPGSQDWLGWAAIDGDTIVLGSGNEDSNASGVNGNQLDNSMNEAGAAYVFVRSGTQWTQEAYLKASNPSTLEWFGSGLALSGDLLAIGALGEDSLDTGLNGNQQDNSGSNAGAVYLFERDAGSWQQRAYIKAKYPSSNGIGKVLSLTQSALCMGCEVDPSITSGVDSIPQWGLVSSGAVFVQNLGFLPRVYCAGDGSGTTCPCGNVGAADAGCGNAQDSAGGSLSALGIASLGHDTLVLEAARVPDGAGFFLQGNGAAASGAATSFGDGLLCLSGVITRLRLEPIVGQAASLPSAGAPTRLHTLAPVHLGGTYSYQMWYRDSAPSYCSPALFNLTNAVTVTWNQ